MQLAADGPVHLIIDLQLRRQAHGFGHMRTAGLGPAVHAQAVLRTLDVVHAQLIQRKAIVALRRSIFLGQHIQQ